MNRIDTQYRNLLSEIINFGEDIVTRGHRCRKLFNHTLTISPDSSALISIRKTAWKYALLEMEYFLSGGFHLDNLDKRVHHWWEDFCTKIHNTMPYSYGYQLRCRYIENPPLPNITKITPRTLINNVRVNENVKYDNLIVDTTDENVGKEFYNKHGQLIVIIGLYDKHSKDKRYLVKFVQSGTKRLVWMRALRAGVCPDIYFPSIYGVGYKGNIEKGKYKYVTRARHLWNNMLRRCYDTSCDKYKYYGARGVKVSYRWHNFTNFVEDLHKLHGFVRWVEGADLQLDKDYYGADIYDVSTCVFLSPKQNSRIRNYRPLEVVERSSPHTSRIFINIQDVATYYSIGRDTVKRMANKGPKEKDPIVIINVDLVDELYRPEILHDQIAKVINGLKHHPNSRRLVWTTWVPEDMTNELVNPTNCHNSFVQVSVREGKYIDMYCYQRSADVMLGLPHNLIAQKAFQLYLCDVCGLEPGYIKYELGDCHIYEQHIDAARELIASPPIMEEAPKLVYSRTSGLDRHNVPVFLASDFSLDGEYKPSSNESLPLIV